MQNNGKPKKLNASSAPSKAGVKSTPPPIPSAPTSVTPIAPSIDQNSHSKPLLAIAVTAAVVAIGAVTLLIGINLAGKPTQTTAPVASQATPITEKAAADQATATKAAADKANADEAAAQKGAAEKAAADQAAAEKATAEKATAEKAAADKIAADKAKLDKLTIDHFTFEKDLPSEDKFDAYFESGKTIATIQLALPESISESILVVARDNNIQFNRHQQEANTWTIKDTDGNYGTLRIEFASDKQTSTLLLKITNFSRATDDAKIALRSGFKLNGVDVRVVAEPLPPLVYARASASFKLDKTLKFNVAGVHPVFTPESASSLASQLNHKISKTSNKLKNETIELSCKCDSDEQISIDGFESRGPIILKIEKNADDSFKMGHEENTGLAFVIHDAINKEKSKLTKLLNDAEKKIKANREKLQTDLEQQLANLPAGQPRKNLNQRLQNLPKEDFKWKTEDDNLMNYSETHDKEVQPLKKIISWKRKRIKTIATGDLELRHIKGIVLPIVSKDSPANSGRYYVIFNNTRNNKDAEQAIKSWEAGTNRKVSP